MTIETGQGVDLEAAVDLLLGAKVSVTQVVADISAAANWYHNPPSKDIDAVNQWLEDRGRLAHEVHALVLRILEDQNPLRIADLAEVAVAGAALLNEGEEQRVRIFVGAWLLDRNAAATARRHLERAAVMGGDQGVLASSLLLRCLVKLGAENATAAAGATVEGARRSNDRAALVIALQAAAEIAARDRRHIDAVEAAVEAVAVRVTIGDDGGFAPEEASLQDLLGRVARAAGRYEQAIEAFERARAVALLDDKAAPAAWFLSELGNTWALAGDDERAGEVLERAAREAVAAGQPQWATRWRALPQTEPPPPGPEHMTTRFAHAAALARTSSDRREEALAMLLEVAQTARAEGVHELEAHARMAAGDLYNRTGRWLQAQMAAWRAIKAAEAAGQQGVALSYRVNLAEMLASRVHLDEAEGLLREALEVGDHHLVETASAEVRQTINAGLARAYENLVSWRAVPYRPPGGGKARPPSPEAVLRLGQRLRARNFLRWLHLGNAAEAAEGDGIVAPMLALRAIDVSIEVAAEEGRELAGLLEERRATDEAFAAAARVAGVPDAPVEPFSADELAAGLEPGDLLVDLLSLHNGVAVTCLAADGTARSTLLPWPRTARTTFLRGWRRVVRRTANADVPSGTQARDDAQADEQFRILESVLAELDAHLLRPLADHVAASGPAQRLLVAVHRELFLVPFWRLTSLVGVARLSVLPTSSAVPVLRDRSRARTGPWLAMGDATRTLRHADLRIADRGEFEDVAARVSVLRQRLPTASVIQLSGHGNFNQAHPHRSGIAVYAEDEELTDSLGASDPWGLNCELLTVAQLVARFHLPNCRLAVLSACETGIPREHAASEFTSLPAALLVAGARNVVASLWLAHDGATALLVRELYRTYGAQRDAATSVAAALAGARAYVAAAPRQEIVEALDHGRAVPPREQPFSHPLYTDVFQHYGVD